MKVLNLYCGVGGNRKLWYDCEVTAVESVQAIADTYKTLFPNDTVVVGDAHQYLIDHHSEFDVIWSSPPCQTHSQMQKATRHDIPRYPDMKLYQEIIFLQHFFKGKWVVENVRPYYDILLPATSVGRHLFWANFPIRAHDIASPKDFIMSANVAGAQMMKDWLGIHYEGNLYYPGNHCPAQILRNCVHPELGLQVYKCALKDIGQVDMFSREENR